MTKINLRDFLEQLRGLSYHDLIDAYLRDHDAFEILQDYLGMLTLLPPALGPLMEGFLDHMQGVAHDKHFWERNGDQVFFAMVLEIYAQLPVHDLCGAKVFIFDEDNLPPAGKRLLLNLFRLMTLNFAYFAAQQPYLPAAGAAPRHLYL